MAHNQEVMGLKPSTVNWMDVSHASYYINMLENIKKKIK
jgi:hypothetical protein